MVLRYIANFISIMRRIQFKVKAQAAQDEQIKIVGSLPCLGDWNPEFGLKMQRTQCFEWQSREGIEVAEGVKFYFKVVRMGAQIEWEKLPNNSNRTYKPKFDSKLIITWSLAEGKVLNESRGSFKVKGMPAVIMKNHKVKKRSSVFDPYKIAKTNSDDEIKQEDNFGFLQKKITMNPKLSKDDIESIYYDTSSTEILVGSHQKIQIYLLTTSLNFNNQFQCKIRDQAQQIQFVNFKWLYFNTKHQNIPKLKRINFYCIYQEIINMPSNQLFSLKQLTCKNSFFIFLDMDLIKKIDLADATASLYLQGSQYQQIQNKIQLLSQFKHIIFDDKQKNQQFFSFLSKNTNNLSDAQQSSDSEQLIIDKQTQEGTLQSLIQELKIDHFGKAFKLNTVYTVSKDQVLDKVLKPHSFLIIDQDLIQFNLTLFNKLIKDEIKGRVIVIVSEGQPSEKIKELSNQNIISIYNNFTKFYMKGKLHNPTQRHNEVIEMIKMKTKLTEQSFGGTFEFKQNYIIYKNDQKDDLLLKMEREVKVMVKDFNYFRTSVKKGRIKVSWSLAQQIRLVRTLCRLKYLSDGKITNFYIISVNKNFKDLKDQIKLLVQQKSQFLQYGLTSKVKYYTYGQNMAADYTILPDNYNQLSGQNSSNKQQTKQNIILK